MAKLELTGFDEIDKMFEILGKPEEFAIKAVNKAAPILERMMASYKTRLPCICLLDVPSIN